MKKANYQDIIGQNFGIYHVDSISKNKDEYGKILINVTCNICGCHKQVRKVDLNENIVPKNCFHQRESWFSTRLSKIYRDMICRCYDPKDKTYRWYGAKGIKICDEWLNSPRSFNDWAVSHGYREDLTIDRINENKDYCPENCHWITMIDNAKYKSTTNLIEIEGKFYTGRDLAKYVNLGLNTINKYLRTYPLEAIKELVKRRKSDKNFRTIRHSHETWFEAYGINVDNYK